MRKKRKLVASLAGLSLIVAGCGGSGSSSDTKAGSSDTEAGGSATTASDGSAMASKGGDGKFDKIGVTDTEIHVGLLADQSGAFAPLVNEIVEAQQAYFSAVNKKGGVDGRKVVLDIEDTAYDITQTKQKYDVLREKVAMISLSTGSPHTKNLAQNFVDDDLIALPLTWYSGWAFDKVGEETVGKNVLETYTNYCLESMNGLEYLNKNKEAKSVAIISFPGEYGGDGAAGAAKAAEALGMEVVYDGTGQVIPPSADNPSPDQSAVISQIVAKKPDVVWATINPATLAAIMGGAISQGYEGTWSGNSPTYSFKLLGTDLKDALDKYYVQSTYISTWGGEVEGMKEVVDTMTAEKPDLEVSDVYILGWTEAMITHALLEKAAANGQLNRSGIVAASREIDVDFKGLAPQQKWAGNPNDYVVRSSFLYDVDASKFDPKKLSDGGGSTGSVLLEGNYTGSLAKDYDLTEPCFIGS